MADNVVILMATYNGENYLAQQLESIASQTHKGWELRVSDDGSTDNTKQILQDFSNRVDSFCLIQKGPCKGFSSNFLSLIQQQDVQGDYYAFSDQDDIWEPNKLERAVNFLKTIPADKPALYCSRTRLVNKHNKPIGFSKLFEKSLSFKNALVQSPLGGNTMVFNKACMELLREVSLNIKEVASHDWWTYIVLTGCGGAIFYDAYPTVRYRQHTSNLVGSNVSLYARNLRAWLLIQGRLRRLNSVNLDALFLIQHKLTNENKKILTNFSKARESSNPIKRIREVIRMGMYRQNFIETIALNIAAFFKKI